MLFIISSVMLSFSRSRLTTLLSKTRNTTLSPNCVGSVDTRKSTGRPDIVIFIRPSWGMRFSAIFKFAKTFTREITGSARLLGGGAIS